MIDHPDLDLRTVDPGLHDLARERFAARKALGFVAFTDNDRALVFDNRFALRAAGYLVVLPPDVRPRRLLTLPEPIRPESAVTP